MPVKIGCGASFANPEPRRSRAIRLSVAAV
jgi:hypothetical protein